MLRFIDMCLSGYYRITAENTSLGHGIRHRGKCIRSAFLNHQIFIKICTASEYAEGNLEQQH